MSTRQGAIDVWDGSTMRLERTLSAPGGWIHRSAWSPEGDRATCCLVSDRMLSILDAAGGPGTAEGIGPGHDFSLRLWNSP